MKIEIINLQKIKRVNRKQLFQQLKKILTFLNKPHIHISFVICDNRFMQVINKRFLGSVRPTDVIAFPLEDSFDKNYRGEVVVSLEQAVRVAPQYATTWRKEFMLYCIHGVLHLLGYDDTTVSKRRVMERKQEEIVKKLYK